MKGTGWLSAIFRAENQQQDVVEDSQLKESENDTAVAGEQPQAETIAAYRLAQQPRPEVSLSLGRLFKKPVAVVIAATGLKVKAKSPSQQSLR
jgi:hypothetical protein